jgi:hypothetical protein
MMCLWSLCAQRRTETTAEEAYLSTSSELLVGILAEQPDIESKLDALEEAANIIDTGHASDNIRKTLEALAGEGTMVESRLNGRLINNYFEVRLRACELLGKIHTPQAKEALKQVLAADSEPSIMASAVRSIGAIGINDANDDAVIAITEAVKKNNNAGNADSNLAAAALESLEKLFSKIERPENRKAVLESIAEISVNWKYNVDVRTRAKELHKKLQRNIPGA